MATVSKPKRSYGSSERVDDLEHAALLSGDIATVKGRFQARADYIAQELKRSD